MNESRSAEREHCRRLIENFENREAIYIEKGALRVRVWGIRFDLEERSFDAEVEEVPTPGLGVGLLRRYPHRVDGKARWSIGACYLTQFSDHHWDQGYAGWSMYFDPRVVQGVVELAACWDEGLDTIRRYERILKWLHENDAWGPRVRPFPDDR